MSANGERPTVGHVNYSFFHSTQSFIYHYLVALRRFRSICLTRSPESGAIRSDVPADLEGDLYPYEPGRGSRAPLWSGGLSVRRLMTRLPPRLAEPVLDFVNRRIAPRLRPDADAGTYLDWAEGVLRQRDARIIHAYFGPVAWRALELRRRLGTPLVVTFLGDDVAPSVAPWWWWWIQDGSETPDWPARLRELFAEGDLFLAEGPHLRQQLIEYGCPPEKAQLQRMALPLDGLPFRARGPRPDGKAVIVFAGRFCEQKGVLYALEAVNELRREGRNVEFRLAGDETMTDGSYAARVYSYIRANGLQDCVRPLGWQNNDACLREMRDGDIFLHPSVVDDEGRSEGGAPTSILEAQALGMPVVSTLHCDIPYVTRPGESALLAPERDSGALAEALRTLLDDPGRWEEMGRAGRRHIEERHDITREAEQLEQKYLALTA
jgi:colanic acid/amylovoran biosynthesis glycosyltransferase